MSEANEPAAVVRAVPAPPPRDPLWFSPLFVLAPARSHSTIATAMLGQHPQLCAFPELLLFGADRVEGLLTRPASWRGLSVQARTSGLCRALAQHHDGQQTDATVAAAARWLAARASWSTADVLDHLLAAAAPRIGVEKSPETSSREEYFARLLRDYPRARFLHLTRHPVPSVVSMHRAWSDKGYWTVAPGLFHQFCLGLWLHQHRRIADFVDALPPDRGLRVRSEDLVNAPGEVLPGICRWLGVDSGPEAIAAMGHPERWPYARIGPARAAGGADVAFLRGPRLHPVDLPAAVALPGEWVVDPWIALQVTALAARLGYGTRLS